MRNLFLEWRLKDQEEVCHDRDVIIRCHQEMGDVAKGRQDSSPEASRGLRVEKGRANQKGVSFVGFCCFFFALSPFFNF